MANPDIPAALVVLQAHLLAAGADLTNDILDVARGLPVGGRQIRYYWSGEVEPPSMGGRRVLNGEMVGQRFAIVATWPLTDLTPATVTVIDAEMQTLAGAIRTRIQGDNNLGGNVTSLDLQYGEPDLVVINGARHVAVRWDLDLAYVEYAVALQVVAPTSKITLSGDFFTHDPGKTLYANIGQMLDGVAKELEGAVRADISSHQGSMPFWTGWTRDHTVGYRTSPQTGKHWALWAAVGIPTTGMDRTTAIRTKAAAAGIERRFHPFRRGTSAGYRLRAVLSANLTRNLE